MRLRDALEAATRPPRRPELWTVAEAVEELGGTGPAARALSGSSDPKTKGYRAAQRRVQRWLKAERGGGGEARRASPEALRPLAERAAVSHRDDMVTNGAAPAIRGTVTVSNDTRRRHINSLPIPGRVWGRIIDQLAQGDGQGAETTFAIAFGRYNQMGTTPAWKTVDYLDLK